MADEKNVPGGSTQPSKLNPSKSGTGDTDKIKLGQTSQMPPKIQLRSADAKKSTTRIDLADVIQPKAAMDDDIKELSPDKQAEFFKKSTIRIEGTTQIQQPISTIESKRTTMRMDQPGTGGETQKVAGGETGQIDARRSTIRISPDAPAAGSETGRIDAKRSTVRVDQPPVGATQQVKGETGRTEVKRSTIRIDGTPGGETQQVQGETSRIDVKKSTIRIDSIPQSGSDTQRTGTGGETKRIDLKTLETGQMAGAKDQTAPTAPDAAGATAKFSDTQLHKMKSETTRLEIPPEVAKRQTGRIQPVSDQQDVFKKRTGKVTTAPVVVPGITPMVPAAQDSGSAGADTIARPKTILVRRPNRPTAGPVIGAVEPTQQISARKSETARLEIPKETGADDRPTTRPKTIRIKRPDGTTARKQMTIARPEEGSEADLPERFRGPAAVTAATDNSPGGFWAILAIAACLVLIGVVVYQLAQTRVPDFIQYLPGRIG